MKILKIDDLIDVCRTQTGAGEILEKEVEKMLVHALLINMCAEFERILKELVDERCLEASDPGVCEYALSFSEAAFSSPSPKNIGDTVKRFGDASDTKFKGLRSEDREAREAWAAYGSIVTNRNHAAHGRPVQVTMDDVEEFYETGHVVLDWFEAALWANNRAFAFENIVFDGGGKPFMTKVSNSCGGWRVLHDCICADANFAPNLQDRQ